MGTAPSVPGTCSSTWRRSSRAVTRPVRAGSHHGGSVLNIDRDLGRFRDIIKGRVRKDLRRYMASGELIGRQGNKAVSVPIHQIGIPRLRYGDNKKGIGQGDGEGDGAGNGPKAGDASGD